MRMNATPGIRARQILANPNGSKGKYAAVFTRVLTFDQMLKHRMDLTDRNAVFIKLLDQEFVDILGNQDGKDLITLA